MKPIEIRKDLKDIRYYYSRKVVIDTATQCVGRSELLEKIEKYNKIVCKAPLRLYDLYVSLYINNNTQESLAERLGYSVEYISKLHRELVKFINKEVNSN